jgi:isopentenyl diphosphate isomerase/L-lactate dehydrogenase-like FMN-dependent dehydrogenase
MQAVPTTSARHGVKIGWIHQTFKSLLTDEITLREHRAAYEGITLLPRMLVDVSVRHMGRTALGQPVSMSVLIAPQRFKALHTRKEKSQQ